MHPNPRRVLPVLFILIAVAAAYWWWTTQQAAAAPALVHSGTVEATRYSVSSEVMGRVLTVEVEEGEAVRAGEPLVTLDPSLLRAQRVQAEASLSAVQGTREAAEAAVEAARANYELLAAGATEAQLAVAESAVERADAARKAAEAAVEALPDAAKTGPQAQSLTLQVEVAAASLDNARAQLELLEAGARPEQLAAAQAQVVAAEAQARAAGGQVRSAEAALTVLDTQAARLTVMSQVDGVVLSRAAQPGDVAAPGGLLLEVADLSRLTLTVYVPESRYGAITLGEHAAVTADSFPGETFGATVVRIADDAEFTPRNTQTVDGRRLTVYAVALQLDDTGRKLKPGMPADVIFAE